MEYYIVPRSEIATIIKAETKEEALVEFATNMELDMGTYFKAEEAILVPEIDNSNGTIYNTTLVDPNLFQFYLLKKKEFKNGEQEWNICVEINRDHPIYKLMDKKDQYIILGKVKGSREDAYRQLHEMIEYR